jgi:glycosyltransferase involved in cell wall biosynthesis
MSESRTIAVSVITPVYKTPLNYFKECLDSLHNQTMLNAEFIIVFDGKDNLLLTFCEDYKKKDSRFKLYIQPHVGVSATRNFGIKQATGEYITFVDADDSIEKNCCQDTYDYAKKNDSDIVLFDYIPVAGQNEQKKYSIQSLPELSLNEIESLQKQTIALTDFKYISAVSTWGKIIRKSIIVNNSIFFSTSIHIAVDRPFMFKTYLLAKKISYICKAFYNYNKVQNSISYKKYHSKDIALLGYLSEIKNISNKFPKQIGEQAIVHFFSAWNQFYFEKKCALGYLRNVKYICSIIKSNAFQDLIRPLKAPPYFTKIELCFLQHKLTFFLWIRAFKRIFF